MLRCQHKFFLFIRSKRDFSGAILKMLNVEDERCQEGRPNVKGGVSQIKGTKTLKKLFLGIQSGVLFSAPYISVKATL